MDLLQARPSRLKTSEAERAESRAKGSVAITPLGIPMIVGPGAITTVMVPLVAVVAVQFVVDGVRSVPVDVLSGTG